MKRDEIIAEIEKNLIHFTKARPGDNRLHVALKAVKDDFTSLRRGEAYSRAYCAQFDVYANHPNAAIVATCVMNMIRGSYYSLSDSRSLLALLK